VQQQISGGLYAAVLAIMGSVMPYMLLPRALVQYAGQEAWLAILLGGLYGLAVSLVTVWAACRFSHRDPVKALRCAFGPWAALPVALLYSALNLLLSALALHDVQTFTSILLLPGTPGWVLAPMIAGVAIYAVVRGVEPVSRIAFAVFLPMVLVILVLPTGLFREFDILQIDPFLYRGLDGLVRAISVTLAWTGQSIVALSFIRHLSPKVNPYLWTAIGVGGAHVLLSVTMALITLVFGSVLPGRLLYPGFELFAIIAVSEAVERIQAGVMVLWLAGGLLKVTVNLFAAVEELSVTFNVHRRGWITAVLAVIAMGAAQILPGPLQRTGLTAQAWWNILHVGLQLAILLLLAIGALVGRLRQGAMASG